MSPEAILGDWIADALAARTDARPLVVGLCGAQGSGKSTVAAKLAAAFPGSVTLSLDDLYGTRAERLALAQRVHPLFATRGVPGTHDVALGIDLFRRIDAGEAVRLPRFDKARDDRVPVADWPVATPPYDLVLFEGWCVGARAEAASALVRPVNALEAAEDADGVWRNHANAALAETYPALFGRIDRLALLAAPDWETVPRWRMQQEHGLRAAGASGAGVMGDAAVLRFTAHYERLTRWILAEMPGRALTLRLDEGRRLMEVEEAG